MSKPASVNILKNIPDPETIKALIRDRIREASELRALLHLAERRQRASKQKANTDDRDRN
jgi:hypothetical protein